MKKQIFYGDLLYMDSLTSVKEAKNSYLVGLNGKVFGIYSKREDIPEEFNDAKFYDYTGKIICPGFVDLHLHAPQFPLSGFQMDLELLDWLNNYVFKEEAKYKDVEFAKKKYTFFVNELKASPSCYFSIFATIHEDATLELMNLLEKSKLVSYVGKVNMDRNSPDILRETTEESMETTLDWLKKTKKFKRTKPILTPRFIPTCSDELMKFLGKTSNNGKIALQSHLDENPNEIAWVKELCPTSTSYTQAYDMFDNLNDNTLMAHCIWNDDKEMKLLKDRGTFVVHCPTSNNNLASGIAPIRKYLKEGLKVGLGSDVAGGHTLSMWRIMANTVYMSKIYWRYVDKSMEPLLFKEAFYLATKGGGEYFGKVGSFEKDYDLSLLVLDDSKLQGNYELNTLIERMERISYTEDVKLVKKFVRGNKI